MNFEGEGLPDGWDWQALASCTVDGNISYGIVQPGKHVESGIPILRVTNFSNSLLELSDVLRVSSEIESKYQRTRLKGGEVLLTLVGSTGQSIVASPEMVGWNVARAVAVIRPKSEIGSKWVNICLQSDATKHFLDVRANTTVQKTLNLKDVRAIPIPRPPAHVKESIESIHSALTEKIELNRRTNQTLEQIAQTLFKSWFVDFDPVRAKVAVREHFEQRAAQHSEPLPAPAALEEAQNIAAAATIAGLTFDPTDIDGTRVLLEAKLVGMEAELRAQLMETAALFPNKLVGSDLGETPADWPVVSLSSMVNLIGGGTPKRSESAFWGGNIPWYSVKDAPQDGDIFVVETEEYITEKGLNGSSTKLLPKGTTIISARGTVGKLALTACEMTMNQSCYGVRPAGGFGYRFNYFNLSQAVETLKRNTHGAVFDTITTKTFGTVKVISPGVKLAEAFENVVTPLLANVEQNLRQSLTLSELRDLLLPKLLSAEIQINPEPLAEAS